MTYLSECNIPTSVKEVQQLGWDWIDIIFFTGDAFVDHPSFGTACIARYLEKAGYRVAVVPQPNWRDDLRDFRKLGAPRLYFAVNAGAMDSMVNHYTAAKRLRHDLILIILVSVIPIFPESRFVIIFPEITLIVITYTVVITRYVCLVTSDCLCLV